MNGRADVDGWECTGGGAFGQLPVQGSTSRKMPRFTHCHWMISSRIRRTSIRFNLRSVCMHRLQENTPSGSWFHMSPSLSHGNVRYPHKAIKNFYLFAANGALAVNHLVCGCDTLASIAARSSRSPRFLRLSTSFLRSYITRIPWLSTSGKSWGKSQRRFPFCLAMNFTVTANDC
jgi:hypothetical protein